MPHGEAVVSNSSGQWLLFTELLIQLPFCTPVIVAVIHFVTHIKAKLSRSTGHNNAELLEFCCLISCDLATGMLTNDVVAE